MQNVITFINAYQENFDSNINGYIDSGYMLVNAGYEGGYWWAVLKLKVA